MAYKVIILYQLYMPSYFLGTFTEYPYVTDSKGYVVQIYSKWESAQGKTDAEEKLECEIIYE